MKKITFFSLLLFLITSCSTTRGVAFLIDINKVEKNGTIVSNAKTLDSYYEDDIVIMKFDVINNELLFELQNKSNDPIHVIWDKTVSVNPLSESERIIHEGVAFSERYKSMANTTIPPKTYISDVLTTARSVRYSELYKEWTGSYIYSWAFPTRDEAISFAKTNNGKPVRLYFNLEKGNETLTYDVYFKLTNPSFSFTEKSIESLSVGRR